MSFAACSRCSGDVTGADGATVSTFWVTFKTGLFNSVLQPRVCIMPLTLVSLCILFLHEQVFEDRFYELKAKPESLHGGHVL